MADAPTFVDRCRQLEQTDSLTSLHLTIGSYSSATPTLRAIASSTHLREVWLAFSDEGDEGVGLLCEEVLVPNTSIESLRLDLKECSREGIKKLAKTVRTKQKLSKLSLLLNNVGQESADYLSDVVAGPYLEDFSIYATQLDLHDRCIGDEGVAVISKALQTTSSGLHSLCIAQSGITRKGVEHIITTLCINRNITRLDLNSNKIDSPGAILLAEHVKSATCSLKTLVLDGNFEISNDGAKAIAVSLCENTSLLVLSLNSCNIGERGAERYATALSQNTTLQELALRGNTEIGNNAVELISRGLRANTALLKLDLSSCGVGDEGCAHLAQALLENQLLRDLLLHKNNISDGGLMALCQTLSKKSHLSSLVLTENRFGEQGTAALLQCLQHNTSLTTLTLDKPTMGGARVNMVELLLAKNVQLQHYRQLALEMRTKNHQLTKKLEELKRNIKDPHQ